MPPPDDHIRFVHEAAIIAKGDLFLDVFGLDLGDHARMRPFQNGEVALNEQDLPAVIRGGLNYKFD